MSVKVRNSYVACLYSEENLSKVQNKLLDDFEYDYEPINCVLEDAEQYVGSLQWETLLETYPCDVANYLRDKYLKKLWELASNYMSVEVKHVESFDEVSEGSLEYTAKLYMGGYDINEIRLMLEDVKKAAKEFVEHVNNSQPDMNLQYTENDWVDEKGLMKYMAELEIKHHPDYTERNLSSRIIGRAHYKWNDIQGVFVELTRTDNETWRAKVRFMAGVHSPKEVYDKFTFRFGATSGKPWKRSCVLSVAAIKQ